MTPVPFRASLTRWCISEAASWWDESLEVMKLSQAIRREALWLRDGPLKDSENKEAKRLENLAQALMQSSERWAPIT